MSVFNRQLFKQGGEVLEVRQTGSQLNPKEFTFILDYIDGQPVAIKKQTQGLGQTEDEIIPIQTNLSASGDPKEAFDVMRKNEMLTSARYTAIGLPTVILGGKGIVGSRVASATLPYLQRTMNFLGRNVSPINFRPFGLVGPTAPASFINPTGSIVTGTTAASIGTGAAMTTPEDVAQSEEGQKIAAEIQELERQSGITGRTSYEAAIKSAIEKAEAGEIPPPVKTVKIGVDGNEVLETEDGVPYREQVRVLRDKMKELYGEDSPLAEEFLKKPQQKSIDIEEIGEDEIAKKRTREESLEKFGVDTTELGKEKEVPLLQNKNFLDLMRNIGIKMVETGDLGRGISLGSAEALKEGRAEELLDEERQAELDKIYTQYGLDRRNSLDVARAEAIYKQGELEEFQMKENIKTRNDLVNNPELSSKMADAVLSAETSDVAISYLKQARALIEAGDVTGVSPAIEEAVNKAFRFLGKPVPLSPREKAKGLLAFVAKADVKELLGESGRTISNIDREIAAELVGAINLKTGKEDVLEQLDKSIGKYERVYKKNIGIYNGYESLYRRFGLVPPHQLGKSLDETRGQPIARIKASDYT
tara:strand:+ start:1341 stop:3110 length:1770 start_codon:yes stop_codon:yes gene_type:complete